MDALYKLGDAPVATVRENLPNPPSYSAVRAKLAILEAKGYVTHVPDGPRYLYRAVVRRDEAEATALQHVLQTFFGGSVEKAVAALVRQNEGDLTEAELDRLSSLIEQSRATDEEDSR